MAWGFKVPILCPYVIQLIFKPLFLSTLMSAFHIEFCSKLFIYLHWNFGKSMSILLPFMLVITSTIFWRTFHNLRILLVSLLFGMCLCVEKLWRNHEGRSTLNFIRGSHGHQMQAIWSILWRLFSQGQNEDSTAWDCAPCPYESNKPKNTSIRVHMKIWPPTQKLQKR